MTPTDPSASVLIVSAHLDPGCERLAQSVALYQGIGLRVDLMLIGKSIRSEVIDDAILRSISTLGVCRDVPDHAATTDDPSVWKAVEAMSGPGAYQVVHGYRTRLPARGAGPVLVLDVGDEPSSHTPGFGENLVLAAFEDRRIAASQGTSMALRLPHAADGPSQQCASGPMIGGIGPWSDEACTLWGDLLAVLARRAIQMPNGLVLAGSPRAQIAVPASVKPSVLFKDTASDQAFGLAIAPTSSMATSPRIASLIARGCPVLIPEEAAQRYEDRWKLPTARSVEDYATLIEHWLKGDGFGDALAQTQANFRHDQVAMAEHVQDAIRTLIEAAGKRPS